MRLTKATVGGWCPFSIWEPGNEATVRVWEGDSVYVCSPPTLTFVSSSSGGEVKLCYWLEPSVPQPHTTIT